MAGQINDVQAHIPTVLQETARILATASRPDHPSLKVELSPLPQFPRDISPLAHLTNIYINTACLQSLPESIGDLRNLRHLQLCNSLLTALPESLCDLGNPKTLFITNNSGLSASR
ncbi:hypothetical protein XthCFBP4691_13410 [Xanthomonas theicola]|uniref:Leucine-rich repeat domain-containing protein n=2 Tax=Xanthomonas theicola TaxID=56464 RepID=A0A2S6ZD90_9XANT|nr:hypothetical protein XthCFBP4691_13410 [Xanthomonas theicola]